MPIPFSKSSINLSDIKNVKLSILSGWLTHGDFSKKFEYKFSNFTESNYSTLVSSCTAGIHLSCLALSIGRGDEVMNCICCYAALKQSYHDDKIKIFECPFCYTLKINHTLISPTVNATAELKIK